MTTTIKSIAFRYGLPLLAFVLIILSSVAFQRLFSFGFDLTLLVIALLIATAWYLGRNPGLFIALVFEASLIYFSTAPFTSKSIFATVNRLALFISLVLFTSSRRSAEQKLREQQELLRQTLASEQAARRDAETAGRVKDEFLATVSHELRTPLSAILGWSMMLKNRSMEEAETKRALEVIERNAKAQGEIIGDLLDISQIVTGKFTIEQKRVEVAAIIRTTAEALRPQAETKSIDLTVLLDEAEFFVVGDDERLRQIVSNLASNAVKFTPDGGAVSIRATRNAANLEITVSDSGIGIEKEFLPFIFDKFRQADASTTRLHGGLGLGLSIVSHLAELHGGNVSAASEGEGKGAVFTLSLPLAENESQANSASRSAT
ncbi:MAG TPA: HAMP domain-containing sensor histidine kinase [Pyrinomonadaceae bacterium]|nr:HAMP domain-containing sensor histidine kinase [Pyrinomonadaceae bacterium]